MGGLAWWPSSHLQSPQAFLTTPATAVLAEASKRVNYRCPYGSGKPLWLALSSFHPPLTSIAAEFLVVDAALSPSLARSQTAIRISQTFKFSADNSSLEQSTGEVQWQTYSYDC